MSRPRRILHSVFHEGRMPGPFHYTRSRMRPAAPDEDCAPYDASGNRMTSSIHSIVNRRARLVVDLTPVTLRSSDLVPPWDTSRRKYLACDPRRLP